MGKKIDAEELYHRMYEEAFEKDSDLQRWDSGCWIRFKLFENVLKDMPEVEEKTGHWVKDGDSYSDLYDYKIRCHCSICGNEKFFIDRKTTNGTPCIKNCDNVDKYCSNCGAKMDGE